jgi:hypothetical protein
MAASRNKATVRPDIVDPLAQVTAARAAGQGAGAHATGAAAGGAFGGGARGRRAGMQAAGRLATWIVTGVPREVRVLGAAQFII